MAFVQPTPSVTHSSYQDAGRIRSLPLATIYLTERCNSRCVSCDYWRHGVRDMDLATVEGLLPDFAKLGTRTVLISGGEPLMHAQWPAIAEMLIANGIRVWLLTSGLSLVKHAAKVATLFDSVTVSLDGANPDTYLAIRGLDAFHNVCAGIQAVARSGVHVGVRVTVQRSNYRELPALVQVSKQLGARQISFLAADVGNSNAFGRERGFTSPIALTVDDLTPFDCVLSEMDDQFPDDFASGFIAESPAKLRRIRQYYGALLGLTSFPEVRCNAPEFSAVIEANGHVKPCFFIPGPMHANAAHGLAATVNHNAMITLRDDIRCGSRAECVTCVCSMWRDPGGIADSFRTPRAAAAL